MGQQCYLSSTKSLFHPCLCNRLKHCCQHCAACRQDYVMYTHAMEALEHQNAMQCPPLKDAIPHSVIPNCAGPRGEAARLPRVCPMALGYGLPPL